MKKLVAMFAILSLIACNKSDDKSSASGTPANASRELVKKPDLTKDQTEEIKGIMNKYSLMPQARLVLGAVEETEKQKTERENEIKKLDSESKQIFDKITADCKLAKPSQTKTGNLSQKGDKQTKKTTESINGEKCPIDYTSNDSFDTVMTEYTSNGDKMPAMLQNSVGKSTSSTKITTQDLQTQLGLKENKSEMAQSMVIDTRSGSIEFSATAKGDMTMVTVKDQKLTMKIDLEMASKAEKMSFYLRMDLEFPSSSPTIQVMKNIDDKDYQIFLNGKKITSAEMKDLFGSTFEFSFEPAKSSENKTEVVSKKIRFF